MRIYARIAPYQSEDIWLNALNQQENKYNMEGSKILTLELTVSDLFAQMKELFGRGFEK